MNKSGQVFLTTFELVKAGAVSFLAILLFFFVLSIINSATSREVNIGPLVNEIYASRLLLASTCLGYDDGTRTQLGVIDSDKFTPERLDQCLNKKAFSAKLTLTYQNKTIEAFNNKDAYIIDSRLCFSEKYACGISSPSRYIAVFDNGVIHQGIINMSVVYHAA